MAKKRQPCAESSPERASDAPLKTYRVHYIITRGEIYEIEAPDEKTAYEEAFSDGEFIDSTDTTDVVDFDIEEVRS